MEGKGASTEDFHKFLRIYPKGICTAPQEQQVNCRAIVGHGIANSAQHREDEAQLQAEAAAYAIQEVANAMQQKQDKQFDQMMEMFKTMMQAQGNNTGGSNVPDPMKAQTPKCKHCNRCHRKAEADCWELEANKDKQPAGYKTKAEKAKST